MRYGQPECIRDVILVLGKRLHRNQLTQEGRSRVEALPTYLEHFNPANTALIFCGGTTKGQKRSEAEAMFEHYQTLTEHRDTAITVLEQQSKTTVENVTNAAEKIIEIANKQDEKSIRIHLVSNDYHLERIFQIQTLLNEQGLLGLLKGRCEQSGVTLLISNDLQQHACVPYPHHSRAGQIFLALDELTVYRVYLEGLTRRAFTDSDGTKRDQPYHIAMSAMSRLKSLVIEKECLQRIGGLERIIEHTLGHDEHVNLIKALAVFNQELTSLNRLMDPEQVNSAI